MGCLRGTHSVFTCAFWVKGELHCIFLRKKAIIIASKHGKTIFFYVKIGPKSECIYILSEQQKAERVHVPKRFIGIQNSPSLKATIWDFKANWRCRDLRLKIYTRCRMPKMRLGKIWGQDYKIICGSATSKSNFYQQKFLLDMCTVALCRKL